MVGDARILQEAERWVWAPPGSTSIEGEGYLLLISDEAWYTPQVPWSHLGSGDLHGAVSEVFAHLRENGKSELNWWVRSSTDPPDMENRLRRLGFQLADEVEILSWDLTYDPARIPVSDDVSVHLVDDEAGVRAVHEVGARGFGSPPVAENAMQRYIAAFRAEKESGARTEYNFLATIGGEPVGTGGMTAGSDIARLWGASVLPEYRGRGAYRALVTARLLCARSLGAEAGLTKARAGSSGPILRRLGFRSHGVERCYSISLGE